MEDQAMFFPSDLRRRRRLAFLACPDDPAGPASTGDGGGAGPAPTPKDPAAVDELGEGGKKALEQERKARRDAEKREAATAAELKKLQEKDLSEQERTTKRAEEAERNAAAAELRAMRLEVAAETGIPLAMAGRLQGATKAELEADAAELLKLIPAQGGQQQPKTPKPDPSQGGTGGAKPATGKEAGIAEAQRRFGTKS
jgi:hypothetical protein